MKDEWFIFTRYFNYLVDIHPARSMIIALSLVALAIGFGALKLMTMMLIFYAILMAVVFLRIFQDHSHRENPLYHNRWLMTDRDRFILIKSKDFYGAEFYIYNLPERLDYYIRSSIIEPKKYDFMKGSIYDFSFSSCRVAIKKEIEKYNLSTLETKILLLNS